MNMVNAEKIDGNITLDDLLEYATESGKVIAFNVSLQPKLLKRLDDECVVLDMTRSAFLKKLFIDYLQKKYLTTT